MSLPVGGIIVLVGMKVQVGTFGSHCEDRADSAVDAFERVGQDQLDAESAQDSDALGAGVGGHCQGDRDIQRGAEWALTCQRADHGFNHFGDAQQSETDAFYFHVATLVMAGRLPNALAPGNTWIGWGHSLVGRTPEVKA